MSDKKEKFSYSKIDTFKQCGFKYKLRYVDKKYVYSDSIATRVGTAIHAAEEAIAKAMIANPGAPVDYVPIKNKLIIDSMKIEQAFSNDYNTADKSGRTYKEKIETYLTQGIYRLEKQIKFHTGYQLIAAEQPFTIEVDGKTFTGIIDRVIYDHERQRYIIQDIKTYSVPIADEDLTPYPLQFIVYVLAAKTLYNISESQVHCQYDLPFCDVIQDTSLLCVGPADFARLMELLIGIDNQIFIPHPSPLCHWCEYCNTNPNQPYAGKDLCPYYSLWTKEAKTKEVLVPWRGPEFLQEDLDLAKIRQVELANKSDSKSKAAKKNAK